ncbi:hypothetical protein WJX75_007474 [Coccomyxa subellipsoidea]|uniref:AP2/ERF domain-containing protein n=1 Tax=Coccomyxa subellipsoidea TaxID=248742 RepID=A0ABR2YZJ7_9CHLO
MHRKKRALKRPRKGPERRTTKATSRFRGVTHHCRTQRWEAHIWQEGKQIYLGGFDAEEQAALAYDLAALKFRGPDAQINFDISNYQQELLHFNDVTKEEVVQNLRRQSKGYQKTSSQFRGVTLHQKGKWEARIGQMVGKKYKYLGLFATELEAAQAYDRESVERKGIDAVTNFDLSEYSALLSPEDQDLAVQRGLIPAAALGHAQPGSHLQLGPHAEHMAEDASPQLFGSSRPPLSPQVGTKLDGIESLEERMQQMAEGAFGLSGGAGTAQQPHTGHHLALLFDDWAYDHLEPL